MSRKLFFRTASKIDDSKKIFQNDKNINHSREGIAKKVCVGVKIFQEKYKHG